MLAILPELERSKCPNMAIRNLRKEMCCKLPTTVPLIFKGAAGRLLYTLRGIA